VLLVIALLGVIAMLVAPRAAERRAPVNDDGAERTAADLARELTRARLMALERGTTVQVVLDPTDGHLWLFATDLQATRLVDERLLPLPPEVGLASTDARLTVRFAPDGSSSGGSVLVRGDAGSRRVTVDRWTGVADAK
jgi:general secretion pathway protein H